MGIAILDEIVIIFSLSILVLLLCHRLRIPTAVGFLLTGVLCGPYGLGFIKNIEDVQTLADIGIVLLLFTIGLEFSFNKIFLYKRFFLLGGTLQVVTTVFLGAAIAYLLGQTVQQSLFWGFLLSLSSTAIVLRALEERRETHTPQGNLSVGILIYQDIVAVVMILTLPLLGGQQADLAAFDYAVSFLFGAAILIATVISGHYLVPPIFHMIARTRSRELFLLSVLTACFAAAWLASFIGMSLALGAFLAGLLIADSDYKSQAVGDILPLQELFTSFFFVSIGMLLDTHFLVSHPLLVFAITFSLLAVKAIVIMATGLVVGVPLRVALLSAFALAQIGEFSFVLSKEGVEYGLATTFGYQLFLAAALLGMALTPFIIRAAPYFVKYLLALPLPEKIKAGFRPLPIQLEEELKDHLIIIGYGLSGRNMALAAQQSAVPYVILEMNPDTVRQEKKQGENIYFGDATHEAVLQQLHIEEARAVAVLINDPLAAVSVVEKVRSLNEKLYLIVRTRYVQQMRAFYLAGANEVVTDEFGASIEVFTRVLRHFSIGEEKVDTIVEGIRAIGQEFAHLLHDHLVGNKSREGREYQIKSFFVDESAPLIGQTIGSSELQSRYGLEVILIKRKSGAILQIKPEEAFFYGDTVLIVGPKANFQKIKKLFHSTAVVLA